MQARDIVRKFTGRVAVAAALTSTSACGTFELLTDNCRVESILVNWPATITRGGTSTNVTLTGAVSPGNIDPSQYNLMKELLITGGPKILASVIWTVPAFEVNGGYIALLHQAPLSTGQAEAVNLATDAGGWGIVSSRPGMPAAVAVRADNFTATSAIGSITADAGAPLRLQIDITARNAANETMRLTGNAQFRHEERRGSCS